MRHGLQIAVVATYLAAMSGSVPGQAAGAGAGSTILATAPAKAHRPPTKGWEEAARQYTAEDFLAWPEGQVDGRAVRVSPTVNFARGFEINHHRVKVAFSGTGSVELSVAYYTDDRLDLAAAKASFHSKFQRISSGKEVVLSSAYPNQRCSWIILQTKGDVKITDIAYACWRGRGTIFGHCPGAFEFAGARLPYRLMYPRDYDPKKSYPLVLSVHGSGGVGTDNSSSMENIILARFLFFSYYRDKDLECFSLVTQIPPAGVIPRPYWPLGDKGGPDPLYHPDYPTVNENGWYVQATLALIQSLIDGKDVNIDPDRIYYTGFSYGGKACWEFLRAGRTVFAAAMSGGGWPIGPAYCEPTPMMLERLKLEVQRYKHIPVLIFVGERDRMRLGSRAVHEVMVAQGGKSKYVEHPGAEHIYSGLVGWSDRKSVAWLFQQNRKNNPEPGKDPFPGGIYPNQKPPGQGG